MIFLSKSISMTFKIEIFQLYDYSEPNHGNETKSVIFSWGMFNLTSYIFCQKILNYFNDF